MFRIAVIDSGLRSATTNLAISGSASMRSGTRVRATFPAPCNAIVKPLNEVVPERDFQPALAAAQAASAVKRLGLPLPPTPCDKHITCRHAESISRVPEIGRA